MLLDETERADLFDLHCKLSDLEDVVDRMHRSGVVRINADSLHVRTLAALAERELSLWQLRRRILGTLADVSSHWSIVLDLFVNSARSRRVSVTSACIAAGGAPTTALRRVEELEECRIVERQPDTLDRRRTWVALTELGRTLVVNYLARLNQIAPLRGADQR